MPKEELTSPPSVVRWITAFLLSQSSPDTIYVRDPLATREKSGPVDRQGRMLPWRWHRSFARDLLGPWGPIVGCLALSIGGLVQVYGMSGRSPVPEFPTLLAPEPRGVPLGRATDPGSVTPDPAPNIGPNVTDSPTQSPGRADSNAPQARPQPTAPASIPRATGGTTPAPSNGSNSSGAAVQPMPQLRK